VRPTVPGVRALLIANRDDADPGFVGFRFRHHGYAFTECHREDPQGWPALQGHDLVLSLGSEWSAYWPAVAESVAAEAALIAAAHAQRVPVFAICFGSQVAAQALGGTVFRAATPEIGWYEIDVDAGADHVARGPWLQWHSDVVTLPPSVSEVARSTVGPQVWHLDSIFAVQFHPEATESMLARWTSIGAEELLTVGTSPDELMAVTRTNVAASRRNANALVDWFVEHVAASAERSVR
jgi:GMP synthase-like glutamine amidotransferase